MEIFAIDDGSTDNSLDILRHYSNKITILSQTNQGLAAVLNASMKKIEGKWFKWFSPDDILYPDAIEILVNDAKRLPENTIVYSNWELIDHKNKKLRDFSESNYNDLKRFEFNVRLLDHQQINVNTSLIPTSLIRQGFVIRKLSDPVAIDYDFFLRAALLYDASFYLIEKPLLKYRIQPNQLSHRNIAKTLSYLNKVREDVLSQLDDSTKKKYVTGLQEYKRKKLLKRKIMDTTLKFITNVFPVWLSDRLIVFYLNKVRTAR